MKSHSRFFVMLLAIALCSTESAGNPSPQVDARGRPTSIPFKLYAGFLIVMEGRIGDRDKLKFVLDTGVTHSAIDRKLAEKLTVVRRAGKVVSFDKTIAAEWTEVPNLEFGPIRADNFPMMIGDLRYFQSYATHVDAVIGLDLLRLSSFSVDFDSHRVSFDQVALPSGVPMNLDDICLSVDLLAGDSTVRLIVDTGAQTLIFYEDRVANRLPQLRIGGEIGGDGLAGSVPSKRGFLPKALLGTTDLGGTVFLVKAPSGSVLPGIDGYFGTAALKAKRIDFNFETKTLAWK